MCGSAHVMIGMYVGIFKMMTRRRLLRRSDNDIHDMKTFDDVSESRKVHGPRHQRAHDVRSQTSFHIKTVLKAVWSEDAEDICVWELTRRERCLDVISPEAQLLSCIRSVDVLPRAEMIGLAMTHVSNRRS